ncbi:thiol:disulfide interchange protein DsbA/DsbL [Marinicella sediminis]|uniref:Thiol:disulfide interchange protein DsbA/DsbL n=1 Tax=Marinicella sediminis TaxID=1792834 RepID=A0ABV7JCF3_9GAMM|nr:thiol:disulfide interchange protein DsbA/DsbL [Marinicella sediminis]
MNKVLLILSVVLFWGCSQANDHADVKEAVKKEAAAEVEAVVEQASEVAEAVESSVESVVEEVAEAVDFQPGIHYSVINPAWDTKSEDEVLVYEFFSYMCQHCASFEPYMKKLEHDMPEHGKVVRIPVVFYPQWKPFAQAYYTFEAMDLVDQAHAALFAAIHQHRKQLRSIEDIANWVSSSFGVDKDEFLSTANSFMIDGQIRKGMQMMQAMGVSSTPTLVTHGKYKPNNKVFRTRDEVLDVTLYLVDMEAENMGIRK